MTTIINPLSGIDVSRTYDPISTSTPEIPGLPFEVGTRAIGEDGKEYLFVVADSAITVNQCLAVSPGDFGAAPLTKALADAGSIIAVAQVAIDSGDFGWVQTQGQVSITLKNSCEPFVPLYTTASAGMLDDTAASQTRIYGIRAEDTSTASGAAKVCWVSNATV